MRARSQIAVQLVYFHNVLIGEIEVKDFGVSIIRSLCTDLGLLLRLLDMPPYYYLGYRFVVFGCHNFKFGVFKGFPLAKGLQLWGMILFVCKTQNFVVVEIGMTFYLIDGGR